MTDILARLSTKRRLVVDGSYPFYDLPTFIISLSPTRVKILFHQTSSDGAYIYLSLSFLEKIATESIDLFKETLIKSELELDVDCIFLENNLPILEDKAWISVDVSPDTMALPTGKQIAITLPLVDSAIELFRQSALTEKDLCYYLSFEQAEPDHQIAKQLIPALAELSNKKVTSGLEESVRLSFDLLRSGGLSCQERIYIPRANSEINRLHVEALIQDHLKTVYSFIPNELWVFNWSDNHQDLNSPLQKKVVSLRKLDFLEQVLHSILPSSENKLILTSCNTHKRIQLPNYQGEYAFISYAHVNLDFADQIIGLLEASGARYWHDTSISAGSLWDQELENRIRNAGVFIACVSDDYQKSKYCTRELKFADMLNKKILPVAESEWTWGEGLQLMFQELQVAFFKNNQDIYNFTSFLQDLAPQIYKT